MSIPRILIRSGQRAVQRTTDAAFSIVELLVAMTLLTLIVLVLMAVFSSTQRAFRASVTQTDVLEGGRSTMELITADFRNMVPCGGVSNYFGTNLTVYYGGVNFAVTNNSPYLNAYSPLQQSLVAATDGAARTNLLQYFFILGRENTKWTGTGYFVDSSSPNPLYPLYRFYAETNVDANPVGLYWNFLNTVYYSQWTNLSHVADGVVHLVVRPYDQNGYWLTNGYPSVLPSGQPQVLPPLNVWFSPPEWGEVGCKFYSNSLPAAVEVQLGFLEDRTMQRALALGNGEPPMYNPALSNYLSGQAGHIQLFRQRVTIPNMDSSAYP